MVRKRIIVIVITVLFIIAAFLVSTGFSERNDIFLGDFSISDDGKELTFTTGGSSSMGYIRGYKDEGGGVKPHYLKFYSTFGGLNSSFGAKSEFVLELNEDDNEIFFSRPDGGYELVLQKDKETGEWVRPTK